MLNTRSPPPTRLSVIQTDWLLLSHSSADSKNCYKIVLCFFFFISGVFIGCASMPAISYPWCHPINTTPTHPLLPLERFTCSHTACITALDRSLMVPLPRASFFLCALNTCSSFFSSSLRDWQYRTFTGKRTEVPAGSPSWPSFIPSVPRSKTANPAALLKPSAGRGGSRF